MENNAVVFLIAIQSREMCTFWKYQAASSVKWSPVFFCQWVIARTRSATFFLKDLGSLESQGPDAAAKDSTPLAPSKKEKEKEEAIDKCNMKYTEKMEQEKKD